MRAIKLKRNRRAAFRRRTPPGSPPGMVVHDPASPFPKIHVISYGPEEIVEKEIHAPEGIRDLLGRRAVTWVNVDGLGDADTLRNIAIQFDLHRLAMEDVVNVHQRAKVEEYPGYLFIVARMAEFSDQTLTTDQLSLFLGGDFVVTFQEFPGDCLGPLRESIRQNKGRVRKQGADYLAYAILDGVVDAYFPILEAMGDRLEDLEERITEKPDQSVVAEIHKVKRGLMTLRRAAWPLRETIGVLLRGGDECRISRDTALYLRDCYDHVVQIIDMLENYRDLAAGLMDFYLSTVSHRMNEIMKVLTVMATIFIPLTFFAGVYGMNFNTSASPWNMPELNWKWGYPLFWVLMLGVAGGMAVFFKRRRWL